MNSLTLTTHPTDARTIVGVGGEIDTATAPELRGTSPTLREHLTALITDGHHHLVLDLHGGRVPRLHRPRRPRRGPQPPYQSRRVAGRGLPARGDPEGPPDHRAGHLFTIHHSLDQAHADLADPTAAATGGTAPAAAP